jgi:hypothetical protein
MYEEVKPGLTNRADAAAAASARLADAHTPVEGSVGSIEATINRQLNRPELLQPCSQETPAAFEGCAAVKPCQAGEKQRKQYF